MDLTFSRRRLGAVVAPLVFVGAAGISGCGRNASYPCGILPSDPDSILLTGEEHPRVARFGGRWCDANTLNLAAQDAIARNANDPDERELGPYFVVMAENVGGANGVSATLTNRSGNVISMRKSDAPIHDTLGTLLYLPARDVSPGDTVEISVVGASVKIGLTVPERNELTSADNSPAPEALGR